jgi:hypothetical protein
VLRDAGLIIDRKEGWNVFYHTSDINLYSLMDMARSFLNICEIEPHDRADVACPCPKCQSVGLITKN